MKIAARTAFSALVASAVPAFPFAFISLLTKGDKSSVVVALIAWSISAAHVVVLGVPAFIVLWRKGVASRWLLIFTGFILGFVPVTLKSLPNILRGGVTNFSGSVVFGLLGAFSAWVFWIVWCRLGPNNSFKPNPLRSSKTPPGFSGGSA